MADCIDVKYVFSFNEILISFPATKRSTRSRLLPDISVPLTSVLRMVDHPPLHPITNEKKWILQIYSISRLPVTLKVNFIVVSINCCDDCICKERKKGQCQFNVAVCVFIIIDIFKTFSIFELLEKKKFMSARIINIGLISSSEGCP